MSNPDVAGIDASMRLAKAGYPQNASAFVYTTKTGIILRRDMLCSCERCEGKHNVVPAPTLGEMLAEIRRRGWDAEITTWFQTEPKPVDARVFRRGGKAIWSPAYADTAADALANALAEAIEKEQK